MKRGICDYIILCIQNYCMYSNLDDEDKMISVHEDDMGNMCIKAMN